MDSDCCHIISSFSPLLGGAEEVTEALCRELTQQGVNVTVLTRRYPGLPAFTDLRGVSVHRVGYPGRGKVAALSFLVSALAKLAGSLRDHRVVHVHSSDVPLLTGIIAASLLRRRLVLTLHTDPGKFLTRRSWRGQWRLHLANRYASRIIVLNDYMKRVLVEVGVDERRIRTIPNGVDVERLKPACPEEKRSARRELGLPTNGVVYLFVGRMVSLKGVDVLLEAWAGSPSSWQLVLVGEGEQESLLKEKQREAGLDNVRFEGRRNDVATYLRAADVFVLPSRREGQSIALIEAMAAGLCVVASDIEGNRPLVQHGVSGLLFQLDDVTALRECLNDTAEEGLRQRLGDEGRKKAQLYSVSILASRVAEEYQWPES